jgi:tetratricopeptide (TPR) repeat protein/tRNA A-37 threonylcarbamoyl transferase component Bud32
MGISPGEKPRPSAPSAPTAEVDAICDAFEAEWRAGQHPRIEDFLLGGDSVYREALLRELLLAEWDFLRRHEQLIEIKTYRQRFVENSELVAELWHVWQCAGEETLSLGRSASFANGRYHLQSRLGEGAQKQVFLARDKELDRDVVIGVLNRRQIASDSLDRLRREARAIARLDEHPNVVSVYDIGEDEGNPFIVTQYVRGGSVANVLSACRPAPLQLAEAIRIAAQTCRALNHAHTHGILHRDIKPTNVWLMRDGMVKLGDFGLALWLDRTELIDEDMRVGTAAYIAPEQALGAAVGPQSDLYSLGVMLYEMVAGRRPFYGDTALAVISQHINSRPVAPSWHNPAINDGLDRLILELLAKSPADRPTSAAVVADSLEAMLVCASPAEARRAPVRETTSLDRLASGVFVGRMQEIMQLREGLKGAVTGRGRLFLVSGEPGSGKTKLTEELTTYARMRGCCVLVGKCFDGKGAPAFWPWVQAIRRYTHEREANELYDVMGPGAADIAQLDSEIRQRLPALPTPLMLEPEQARFRLFDSITTFLRNAALSRPVLLILDDLQWADEPSLCLLQFLAQEIRDAHLLIVGTYREVALGRGHPLARTLAEVGREDLGHQIRLEGLSREEVGRYIELTSGISSPEILVQRIWDKTEGNPFFVSETIRLLITEGLLENPEEFADLQINIPPRVRDVVRRRLEQLSDHCNETLTLAAVYGREFSLEVIEALRDADNDRVLDDLEEAVDARIIGEAQGDDLSYLFTHDLVREAVCDQVKTARRTRMHAHIASVLERLYQGREIEHHLAELARHFLAAGRAADPDKAIDYSVRAGRRSLEQLAYEEAARHFGAAVKVLESKDVVDQSRLCELLQNLGEAQKRAGQFASLETFRRAFKVARGVGAGDQMALAAIAFEWLTWSISKPDADSVLLCKEALLALPADRRALRAKLLAAEARALKGLGFAEKAAGSVREAVELARQAGEPSTLCYVLELVLHMSSGPAHISERLSYAIECLESARRAGDLERMMFGTTRWIYALFEAGEIAGGVDRAMEELESVVRQIRQPQYSYVQAGFITMRALLEGRFTEAEKLALQAVTLGQRLQSESAEGIFGMQMFVLRREQGRLHEVAPIVEMFVREHSGSSWKPGLALMYVELGLTDKARTLFEELAAHQFTNIQQDGVWAASITFLVEVCASLGDRDRAEVLYRVLSPYAGYAVVASDWASFGAASRFLGQLAATMGRWQEAESHFDQALAMNARMGAKPWLAHTQFHYANTLLKRFAAGDIERARILLDESETIARQLGMRLLETQITTARRQAAAGR